jgi:tetratricopeptide (TPR) repeat protein
MGRNSLFLIVASCLVAGGTARAGIYVTVDQDLPFPLPPDFAKVKRLLDDLNFANDLASTLPTAPKSEHRQLYLARVEKLEAKQRDGDLSLLESADLGGAYLRLGRYAKASTVLEKAARAAGEDAPERFLLLANLATAYQGQNRRPEDVIAKHQDALDAMPAKPPAPGWSQEQWDQLRIAERYQLLMLKLRAEERAKWTTFDVLFPKVRFSGPKGEYQAGPANADTLHELPRDALQIVIRLLTWAPSDPRLFWLYGEVLNAEGNVREAALALDHLGFTGIIGEPELRRHQRVLNEAKEKLPKEAVAGGDPIIKPVVRPPTDGARPPEKAKANWMQDLDMKTLGIGFLVGVLVAVFGGLQLYLWGRRKKSAASVPQMAPHAPAPVDH